MQRDRAGNRKVGAEPLLAVLDEQFIVEQPPPQNHLFAGEFRSDFILRAIYRDTGIDRHFALLRLTGKGAETFPTAHGANATGGQVFQPVFDPRMRFGPMVHGVVSDQEVVQPGVGFGFVAGFLEVVQGFMEFFDRTERTFDLALRPRSGPPAILAGRHVGPHIDAEIAHHPQKHLAAGNRPVVQIKHQRNPLQRTVRRCFRRHRVEQKTQCGDNVLAIDTAVLLISDATAIIDHAEQHQRRRFLIGADP